MTGASVNSFEAVWETSIGRVRTIFTAVEVMGMELPPIKWVIPDLLPEGVTLLAGKPKLGKSWLAFGIVVAVI